MDICYGTLIRASSAPCAYFRANCSSEHPLWGEIAYCSPFSGALSLIVFVTLALCVIFSLALMILCLLRFIGFPTLATLDQNHQAFLGSIIIVSHFTFIVPYAQDGDLNMLLGVGLLLIILLLHVALPNPKLMDVIPVVSFCALIVTILVTHRIYRWVCLLLSLLIVVQRITFLIPDDDLTDRNPINVDQRSTRSITDSRSIANDPLSISSFSGFLTFLNILRPFIQRLFFPLRRNRGPKFKFVTFFLNSTLLTLLFFNRIPKLSELSFALAFVSLLGAVLSFCEAIGKYRKLFFATRYFQVLGYIMIMSNTIATVISYTTNVIGAKELHGVPFIAGTEFLIPLIVSARWQRLEVFDNLFFGTSGILSGFLIPLLLSIYGFRLCVAARSIVIGSLSAIGLLLVTSKAHRLIHHLILFAITVFIVVVFVIS